MSIELNTVSSGYNLPVINDNFKKLEDYINQAVLIRLNTGVAGEAKMNRDLDMDGRSIINLGTNTGLPSSILTVSAGDARYYNIDGDTLTGPMNVNSQMITGLVAPVASTSPVRKIELDNEASYRAAADANLQGQIVGAIPPAASPFSVISWHDQHVTASTNIPDNKNAWSFGPTMTIDPGVVITIGANSFWTIANGEVN